MTFASMTLGCLAFGVSLILLGWLSDRVKSGTEEARRRGGRAGGPVTDDPDAGNSWRDFGLPRPVAHRPPALEARADRDQGGPREGWRIESPVAARCRDAGLV